MRDAQLLLGRVLIASLFLPTGVEKIMGWPGIVHYIAANGAPFPWLGGLIAIFCEVVVTALILVGILVRPMAVVLALFSVGTALIAHRYWQMEGPAGMAAQINFFKNMAIGGGLLGLSAAGSGRFALRADS